MKSFLIKISRIGAIEQVVWSDPDDCVSGCGTIFDIFGREAKSTILAAIKRGAARDDAFFCDAPLRLADKSAAMALCVAALSREFLVFAFEQGLGMDARIVEGHRSVVGMFMNIIRNFAVKMGTNGKSASDAPHAEMVEALLNELRSRKNQLEEANQKLNDMNRDLNNRLVKDSLTGLVSRYQYRSEIEYLIDKHPGKKGIFVFIDIDDFKSVNDRFGHAVGDKYLVEFAERLKRLPQEGMVRMRISGDEFGLFAFGMNECGPAEAEALWKKIQRNVLASPIEVDGRRLPISVSAGMAVYGIDTKEVYELIELADRAMYSAKRRGKNRYCVYRAEDVPLHVGKLATATGR